MRQPRPGARRARDPGRGRLRLDPRLLWTLGAGSAAISLALVPFLATADFLPDRALWIVLDVVIGGGFTAVGLFAWYRRPDNRVGALMVATAFAWYFVVAGNTEPAVLWTFGQLFSNLFAATAIHLLLAFPSGRLETELDRVVVGIAYVATTVLWLPVLLFSDPADFGCTDCSSAGGGPARRYGVWSARSSSSAERSWSPSRHSWLPGSSSRSGTG
jgi:hypothetical protein